MKTPKFTIQNISQYILIFIVLLNFIAIYYIYQFFQKKIWGTLYIDQNFLFLQNQTNVEKLKTKDFDAIISNLQKKQEKTIESSFNGSEINNQFDSNSLIDPKHQSSESVM